MIVVSNPVSMIGRLSVGVKLTLTFLIVVFFTALVLSLIQVTLTRRHLEQVAQMQLEEDLGVLMRAVGFTRREFTEPAWSFQIAYLEFKDTLLRRRIFYGVWPDGSLILPSRVPAELLPSRWALMEVARRGRGVMRTKVRGKPCWLAFGRNGPDEPLVVLQMWEKDLAMPGVESLFRYLILGSLGVALVVAIFAAWIGRRELAGPLRRLAEEGERVARGDLTPPDPLEGRYDEVGRLSRVLRHMTLRVREMLEEVKASETRFRQLFTDNHDAIFIIGEHGGIEEVNPAAAKIFGYTDPEDMRRCLQPDTRALWADQSEREYYLQVLEEQGFVKDFPALLRRKDGTTFNALITATRRGHRGRFGLVRDVTQSLAAQRALLESEERYRRLIENTPDIIYRWNLREFKFDYISPAVSAITGYSPMEVLEEPELIWRSVHPEFQPRVREMWRSMVKEGEPQFLEHEYKFLNKRGETRWLRERSLLLKDPEDRPLAVEGVVTDVTERKKLEQELIKGQQMVEATLQGLPVAVMVVNREHRVVHWNRAMERLTGVPAQEMVGTSNHWQPFYPQPRPLLADLMVDLDWEGIKHYYGSMDLKPSPIVGGGLECEGFFEEVGGRDRYLYFLAAPILDEDGRVARVVESLVDLSDKRRLEEELRRLSVTDNLTGLFNQRFFYATLSREVETARRYGVPLSLLLLDLDHFKQYNDTYGHLEGDRVLAACAQAVKDHIRATDLACRYGGEEFVVLLPRTDLDEAAKVAERIRAGVASLEFRPTGPDGRPHPKRVTVSIGVAMYRNGHSTQELVRRADQAMYAAKRASRNRVAIYRQGRIEVIPTADPT